MERLNNYSKSARDHICHAVFNYDLCDIAQIVFVSGMNGLFFYFLLIYCGEYDLIS